MTGEPVRAVAERGLRAIAGCSAAIAWVLLPGIPGDSGAAIWDVGDSTEVCPATADPCLISQPITVKTGAILDFGVRELRIVPGGLVDIGAGFVEIRCGGFTASTPGAVAINMRGPAPAGGQDGGSLSIEVRGACSGGGTRSACYYDAECASGICVKGGGVSVVGAIEAQGIMAGSLSIRSAGDVHLPDGIDLDSTDADGDGGQLDVTSTLGSVVVGGRVEATSGRLGFGGVVTVAAAGDVALKGILDASGGDFDGGEVEVAAGGDISVAGRVSVDSTGGEGAGGFVSFAADGDLSLSATAVLSADGHQSVDNFAGDGGTFLFSAGGDFSVAPGARVAAAGARPDGAGGVFDAVSEGTAALGGTISVVAKGGRGLGGSIALRACVIDIPATGVLENVGDSGDNALTASGSITARAGAKVTADSRTGTNTVRYRDASNPPVLLASFVPAPVVQVLPDLPPCEQGMTTTTVNSTTTTLPGTCGNGVLDEGEECDDGDRRFERGDACGPMCRWIGCADADGSGDVNASDALLLLLVAVGLESCDSCVCNVDSSPGPIAASDALRTLQAAVGLPVDLVCPPCSRA